MSEVAVRTPTQELVATIRSEGFVGQVEQALPGNVSPERFVRVVVTAINQTPELVAVDRGTLFNAVIRCAQDGLLPDGREAALVIFNDKNAQGGKRATYLPMVGGYRKIAAKHGMSLEAFVVYEHDAFDYQLGFEPTISHKPPKLGDPRGTAVGAYAVARHKDGRKWLDVMDLAQIEAVRKVSRAATSQYGPWVNHWDEMARKTVARRLYKQLPLEALDETDARILEHGDTDADLPPVNGSGMTRAEADVSAALGPMTPPHQEPPEDEAEWVEAEVEVEPAFVAPPLRDEL